MLTGRMYLEGMPPRTLARVPLAGGAPRDVAQNVLAADWAPDGRTLAVTRVEFAGASGGAAATVDQWLKRRQRLEFPIGKVLYETASGWLYLPRVSPRGDRVAFVEERADGHSLELVDLAGSRTTLCAVSLGRPGSRGLPTETKSGTQKGARSGRSDSTAAAGSSPGSPER